MYDHFERVASAYESLRTTDEPSVQTIRRLLPDHPVTGIDIGCGTGRYTRLLHALLPNGSLIVGCDVSAAMLTKLQASNHGPHSVAALRCTAEDLPIRDHSVDFITSFNSVHHFDLGRFLTAGARALRPDGQLFVYTRTPEQNARTIWGRHFPGFAEREQRLYRQQDIQAAIRQTKGLQLVGARNFQYLRSSTPERLRAQAEGRHYSTFSLYTPDDLSAAIEVFLARVPDRRLYWIDEYLLVAAQASSTLGHEQGPGVLA